MEILSRCLSSFLRGHPLHNLDQKEAFTTSTVIHHYALRALQKTIFFFTSTKARCFGLKYTIIHVNTQNTSTVGQVFVIGQQVMQNLMLKNNLKIE